MSNIRTVDQLARQFEAGAQVMVIGGPMSLWSQRLQRDKAITFHPTLGRREDGDRAITIPPYVEVVLPCIKISIRQLANVRTECDSRGVVRPREALSPHAIRELLAHLPSQRSALTKAVEEYLDNMPGESAPVTPEEREVAQPVKTLREGNLHEVLMSKPGIDTPPKLRTYTGTMRQWVRDQLNGHGVQPSIGELYRGAVSVGFVTTQEDVSRAVVSLIGETVTGRRAEDDLTGLDEEFVAAVKQIDDAIVGLELARGQIIAAARMAQKTTSDDAKLIAWAKSMRELMTLGPQT